MTLVCYVETQSQACDVRHAMSPIEVLVRSSSAHIDGTYGPTLAYGYVPLS
jgi:hypothetical protein